MRQHRHHPASQGGKWIRQKRRLEIYCRDGMACRYCHIGIESGIVLTLDHVVPVSDGGTNCTDNLITACHVCNSKRGNASIDIWCEFIGIDVESIYHQLSIDTTPYRAEALSLIARRGSYGEVMSHCRNNK
jgi:hypothetical protein